MSNQGELDFSYSLIDRLFRLSMGDCADYSGAMYNGDFSLSLEEAQRRKHEYVVRNLGVGPGTKLLDLTCGWGPLLWYVKGIGAEGVGLNLSSAQVAACRAKGLDVRLMDCRTVTRDAVGGFDAVASIGGCEHFCSLEDYRAGRQEATYRDVFQRVATLLPEKGRFYLQTMVFGRNMVSADELDINAPRDSDGFYLALMDKQFPGSWLPYGKEQLEAAATPHFRLVSAVSGRLDYIETIRQWRKRFAQPSLRKMLLKLSLLPRYLLSRDFRLAFTSGISANSVCFERELLDHYRLVFERT